MAFAGKNWKDSPDHTTPINSKSLKDMEGRLSEYSDTKVAKSSVGAAGEAGKVLAADDPSTSDARIPEGEAGGVLAGNYPEPSFADGVVATPEDLEGKADLDPETEKLDETQLPLSVVSGSNEPVPTPGVPHVFNVVDGKFGAKGNGTTDDHGAIQAAINAASAVGGTVYLPVGTFKLTAALTLKSNVTLEGVGPLTVLVPAFAEGIAATISNELAVGNENISLRNFRLDRSGSHVQHGILLNGVTNLNIDGVEIIGVPSQGSGALAISSVLPGGIEVTRMVSTNVRVTNCLFQNSNNFGVQVSFVSNCVIAGNVFDNCYREAIGVEPELGCVARNVTIVGNSVTSGQKVAEASETGVILVTGSSEGAVQGCTIVGNSVEGTVVEAGKVISGILALGSLVTGVVISGNSVRNMNGHGISIGSAGTGGVISGAVVSDNLILNCNLGESIENTGSALSLRNSTHILVEGNYIQGAKHSASIQESSAAANNKVCNNFLRDTVKLVLLESSGTVVFNNKEGADGDPTIGFGSKYTNGQTVSIDTKAATVGALTYRTEGSSRWSISKTNGAESGENAGSDLQVLARSDTGTLIGTAFEILRKTRNARFYAQLQIDGELKHGGTKAGLNGAAPVAKAAAIASPPAELAALKTAVDAIRTAIKNIGITE